ncbi:MAG: MFS transporter [Novosphingobium sp.]
MAGAAGTQGPSEWREHWQVLPPSLAGVMLCAVHGYSLGVMVAPLEREFGWSRAAITGGPFIIALIGLWAAPLTGYAIDRFGPRRIGLAGVALFCGALALLSTATANVISWWLLWALLGFASMFILPTVWTAAINSRFARHRGMALAAALCGTGITAAVIPMLTDWLVTRQGWRGAYLSLGGICFVVVFPLVLLLFRGKRELRGAAPTAAHRPSRAELRAALAEPRFVRLGAAVTVFSLALCAVTTNAVPVLTGRGFGHAEAAQIAGLIGIGSICGRLGGGYLLDRMDARKVAAGSVVAPIIAALLLLAVPHSAGAARVGCLLIGLSAGAEYDATAYLAARHFGMRNFGTLFGAISGLVLFTNGVAPLVANAIYDVTHSYDIVLWAQLPLGILSAVLFLALGPYPQFSEEAHRVALAEAPTTPAPA